MTKKIIIYFSFLLFCVINYNLVLKFFMVLADSIGSIVTIPVYIIIFYLIFRKGIFEKICNIKIYPFFKIIIGLILGCLFYVFVIDKYIF